MPRSIQLAWEGHGLPIWLFKGGFKVSSGTVEWYRSNSGTDFDTSEMASPEGCLVANGTYSLLGCFCKLEDLLVGVRTIGTLSCRVYIRVPDFLKLPFGSCLTVFWLAVRGLSFCQGFQGQPSIDLVDVLVNQRFVPEVELLELSLADNITY